jgi:hypothetical protein
MSTFIILARFKPDTQMDEVRTHVAAERAQVGVLREANKLGAVHLAMSRQTGFLEVHAADAAEAEATARTLPMSRWWDLDVYPTVDPLPA